MGEADASPSRRVSRRLVCRAVPDGKHARRAPHSLGAQPGSADPRCQNEGPTHKLMHLLYEPLVGDLKSGSLAPTPAVTWRVTDDPTIWEFKLRPHVTFRNGDPLNTRRSGPMRRELPRCSRETSICQLCRSQCQWHRPLPPGRADPYRSPATDAGHQGQHRSQESHDLSRHGCRLPGSRGSRAGADVRSCHVGKAA